MQFRADERDVSRKTGTPCGLSREQPGARGAHNDELLSQRCPLF
jgi:hypothetical protein